MWYILSGVIGGFISGIVLMIYSCCVVAGRCENEINGDYNDNEDE